MEPLPKSANFRRSKMLWEIGLHMAGDPTIPYGGNRDLCITVGSGGQAEAGIKIIKTKRRVIDAERRFDPIRDVAPPRG